MANSITSIANPAAFPSNIVDASTVNQRLPTQTLDQEDFLKLLVAQMVSQDPLNPKSDIEMIPQMVSFSQLAQSSSMQTDIAQMRAEQELLRANSLLGRTVEVKDAKDAHILGEVTAVQMVEGTPKLAVNGQLYDLGQLLSIKPTVAAANSNPTPS